MTEPPIPAAIVRARTPLIDLALPVIGLAFPLVSFFASKGTVLVLGLAALVAGIDLARGHGRNWPFGRALPAAVALFLVWTALSATWEHTHGLALPKTLQLLGLAVGGGIAFMGMGNASETAVRRTLWALGLGLGLGLGVTVLERASACALTEWGHVLRGQPRTGVCHMFRYKIGVGNGVFLAVPMLSLLWCRSRALAVVLVAALAAALIGTDSHTSAMAALVGAAAAAAFRWLPRAAATLAVASTAAIILAAPLAVSYLPTARDIQFAHPAFPSSLAHRLMIWHFTTDHIAEKPVLGWGADGAREIPGGSDKGEVYVLQPQSNTLVLTPQEQLPLHPHNNGLQVWLELGGIGAVLYVAVLLTVIATLFRIRPPGRRAGAFALMAMAVTMGLSSFGAWQSWWLASLWLIACLTRSLTRPRQCAA